MYRRELLDGVTATLPLTVGVPTTDTRRLDCATIDEPPTAPLGDNESFTVTGSKDVHIHWRSNDWFGEQGYKDAIALGIVNGTQSYLNKSRIDDINDYVVMHELAHNLGYRHGDDDGIVAPLTAQLHVGDKDANVPLADSTRDVVASFDAYQLMDEWTADELGEITTAFAAGETKAVQLGHAVTKFASGDAPSGAFIRHSCDGFGGEFASGYRVNPEHVFAGHFYGLPSV